MSIVAFFAIWFVVALVLGIILGKAIHWGMNSYD